MKVVRNTEMFGVPNIMETLGLCDDTGFFDAGEKVKEDSRPYLSIQDGIDEQHYQLGRWYNVLNDKYSVKLTAWAMLGNHKARNGHDILRGELLTEYVEKMVNGEV